jgi:hypothetical protein
VATQPVLGGVTLPWPSEYRAAVGYRGGQLEMADGSVVTDLVTATAKRRWTLTWKSLSTADRATVESALATVKNAAATFTSLEGVTTSVTRDAQQGEVEFTAVPASNGRTLWQASLALREV